VDFNFCVSCNHRRLFPFVLRVHKSGGKANIIAHANYNVQYVFGIFKSNAEVAVVLSVNQLILSHDPIMQQLSLLNHFFLENCCLFVTSVRLYMFYNM